MNFPEGKYTDAQKKWCQFYERETGFEPHAMADYEAGHLTFVQAAKDSIGWFENWSNEVFHRITKDRIPGHNLREEIEAYLEIKPTKGRD